MHLTLFGQPTVMAVKLAVRLVEELEPDRFLVLVRNGLAVPAADEAYRLGIEVARYWPDFRANKHRAMEIAIRQMVRHEQPLTVICVSPRRGDIVTVKLFAAEYQGVIVGRFDKARQITWTQVPAKELPSVSGTITA